MTSQQEVIQASPTKAFFVEMLTRDIELEDAILDLLDNCIDGVHRTQKQSEMDDTSDISYSDFWARIDIKQDSFEIKDNCGGIPLETARNYAFRMGRPAELSIDEEFYTIGTYGIGMKRSIFKMGKSAVVISSHESNAFQVSFTSEWLTEDQTWELPMQTLDNHSDGNGTTIIVTNLYDSIARRFDPQDGTLLNNLSNRISQYYSFIIQKGFRVYLNNQEIKPRKIELLSDNTDNSIKIEPYLYKNSKEEVEIDIAVGFYRANASEKEVEDELQGKRRTTEEAGWTIVCNDRVVVYCDKTRLTGWGEFGVPNYHTQFIAIKGIVHFRSKKARLLPITTTKRGIDPGSDIYLYTRKFMIEGLKIFTTYTNKWKKYSSEEKEQSKKAIPQTIQTISETVANSNNWKKVQNRSQEKRYIPKLPMPPSENQDNNQTIQFVKPREEVQIVSEFLFEDENRPPAEVGKACFQYVLDLDNKE
ncbi:MAG: ATP-binding protein [Limnothrix sp.]